MSAILKEQGTYADQFFEIAGGLPGHGEAWLDRLRRNAIQRFLELGFPTTRLEEWKYTNVAPLSRHRWKPSPGSANGFVSDSLRSNLNIFPSPRLVFVDGMLNRDLSVVEPSESGLQIGGLSNFLAGSHTNLMKDHLGRYATTDASFVAWNSAFFTDGACVSVPAGLTLSRAVHVIFLATGSDEPCAIFPRNLIVVGEGAQVRLVEAFLSAGCGMHLTNAVTEIAAGEGATIDYVKVEAQTSSSFHVSTVKACLDRDADFTSHSFSFGAALVRNDLDAVLDGEGSRCSLDGLFLVDGQRLVDNHTRIDHRKPHATSRELYKGVLAGRARGVFNGAIIVRKDAQKTDAVQHSKNLLLSEQAEINTKPQLEISADDVRCAHGASIGQLDQEALFYLRTRGVNEYAARRVLIHGFAAEVLDHVHDMPVRRHLEKMCDEWLNANLEGI